jgi:hypothetical protein
MMLRATLPAICALAIGCASALKPLDAQVAGPSAPGAAPQDPASFLASIRALLRQIDAEQSSGKRETLASQAVVLGQRCDQQARGDPHCDYGLALALGVQARERPATAHDGLPLMAERLQRAAARDPGLDHSGPERVLGFLLVRAPGWPTGPGDPESGLEVARKAAARDPGYAPNWLAVAEASDVTGDAAARLEAAQKALALADQAAQSGEPDAAAWQRDAKKLLAK